MFSQFRSAMESLAQMPQPRRDSDTSVDEREAVSRSRSLDSNLARPLSSVQLAESALSNLRKSLATQRTSNPSFANKQRSQSNDGSYENRPYKSSLEERLKASFSIGEASRSSTPEISARASPVLVNVSTEKHLLSPSLTPLPDSPVISPSQELGHIHYEEQLQAKSAVMQPVSSFRPKLVETRYPEADIPLPAEHEEVPLPDKLMAGPKLPDLDPFSEPNVESVQETLRILEQRFAEVSSSLKKLQDERIAAERVLRECTPLEGLQDVDAFRDHLQNLTSKLEASEDEVRHLNGKLTRQEDRIEELRDIHQLESSSQSDQIEKLRKQVDEAESLVKASQETMSQSNANNAKLRAEVNQIKVELERSVGQAKEEEEKRVKAISLLKTVRQKLLKAEKDKDDALKEAAGLRERDKIEKEKEQAERINFQREIEALNTEREKALAGLKAQFDKEVENVRDRYEKEIFALKGQFELEMLTAKSMHSKEIVTKEAQITTLENSVNNLSRDKNTFFDQLELRQAELESLQSHVESLQNQNAELQYQTREFNDRLVLLQEHLVEARRESDSRSKDIATSTVDAARVLSAAEARFDARISEVKQDLLAAERDRNEAEAEWSRKLREKSKEVEELRDILNASAKARRQADVATSSLQADTERLNKEVHRYQLQVAELQYQANQVKDTEVKTIHKTNIMELSAKVTMLEQQLEEGRVREAQLKASNKALRDEQRKVQASVSLLEKQRNAGVGYWTSRPESTMAVESRTSISSTSSGAVSRTSSPGPLSVIPTKSDEEINLEYLRNVILQFLEHKEMRPNLVRVLSIILRFTPQETRRLIAKI